MVTRRSCNCSCVDAEKDLQDQTADYACAERAKLQRSTGLELPL